MTADEYGGRVKRWDIRAAFGSGTDMLIRNREQGRALAKAFGASDRVVLLRGHGFVGAGRSASQLIRMCNALLDNAVLQLQASRLGPLIEMSEAEVNARQRTVSVDDEHHSLMRSFEYDAIEAGVGHLLDERRRLKAGLEVSSGSPDDASSRSSNF